ncbi:hypothetical protein [Streptomyces sp. SID685]|uniref:hypothetical protein n=1 Tax=Streptomyces sp. SID685 TaxID=2690322 RepID=UPI001F339FD7|nr:hypothetical protein [Streptomyces sp. SID685]
MTLFRCLFLAGERLDPDTYDWARTTLGVPVIDNWWQTETGWPIAANRTRSGKILRSSMRSLANGDDTPAPATIDDPAVLESLRLALRKEN